MKRTLALCLALLMLCSCGATETPGEEVPEAPSSEVSENTEITEEVIEEIPYQMPELQQVTGVPEVSFEPDWTVDTSSETALLELTKDKYQGRMIGTPGNIAAGQWIEQQFLDMGLQPLPGMEDLSQKYNDTVYQLLPAYAAVVAPDGTETELELAVDWIYKTSYEEVDLILPLSPELEDCAAGLAFLDANVTEQESPWKYIGVYSGDVERGFSHFGLNYAASRVMVTEEVYEQLTQEGAKLHLKLPKAAESGYADNIVGYLPGEDSSKAVLICAKFDGNALYGQSMPGAFNNAGSVAAMLQTAEWLSKAETLPCDVIFAALNGGQTKRKGGEALATYLKEMDEPYDQVVTMVLSCVGWKNEEIVVYTNSDNLNLVQSVAGGLNLRYKPDSAAGEQLEFKDEPAKMFAISFFNDAFYTKSEISTVMSTAKDTAENIDPAILDNLAKNICCWVMERGADTIPSFTPVVWW